MTAQDTFWQLLEVLSDLRAIAHAKGGSFSEYGEMPIDQRPVYLHEAPDEVLKDLLILLPEVKRLTLACGAVTPDTLNEPVGDTPWWDYSSGDGGGYTVPTGPYSPPT